MATYFHGTHDIHPESIQKLYLMNPNYINYSDTQPASHLIQLPYTQQAQHLVGIPIQSGRSNQEVNILGMQSGLIHSKYLKYAQQLLDEMVSLGKVTKDESIKEFDTKVKSNEVGDRFDKYEKGSVELTIMERQEIQMKKAKLVNMLDEVIQRYKQYHNQMQLVVSSFEAAAGVNSAKTYTALALQTISKQFHCLKYAITGQIRAAAKSLGEEISNEGGTNSKISRLQFVDQQVRQQRALQQLGMIQHNAWRPQRGLPERSVSVLRAWLFEHFLHPYPKDTDKKMLAKQTGLTRSQVSNWFINARVRLWKPMVEEMYKEEMKDQEQNNVDEKTSNSDVNEGASSESNAQREIIPQKLDEIYRGKPPIIAANYNDNDDNMFIQSKMKRARMDEESMNGVNENSIDVGEYVDYSIGGIERFGIEQFAPRISGNNISLTLGLTNYDSLSLSGAQPTYLSNNSIPFETRVENSSENYGFSNLSNNSIESRKRFAAQLLPDFVA